MDTFQPFYQETSLEQEVNADMIYYTEKELLGYVIYNQNDIVAFVKVWNKHGKQDNWIMGLMTSVLKAEANRYNVKNLDERYQFRGLVCNSIRWYINILRRLPFDKDM